MNTLICAGGSATRVLEAVLHLCAAGLGPDRLRVLRIDPDHSNGNATRVEGLIDTYQALHRAFGGKLGPHKLFRTELEPLGSWSPVQPGDTLSRLLHFDLLGAQAQDVVRLLFTQGERQMGLDQGFRGHTAVGAAAMSLVTGATQRPPWSDLCQRIRSDLEGPGARVFLAASVFGGTGASAIHPIARFLRGVPERNASLLKIGVAALVPYFKFKSGGPETAELAARAEDFALATKAAALFYQRLREAGDWDFDGMYWIGDSSPARDLPYAAGGPDQRNPAHFVDLLSALAGLEFFHEPVTGKACYFSGPRQKIESSEPESEENVLDWPDLPLRHLERRTLKRALWRFLLTGAAHVGFWQEVLRGEDLKRRPAAVPWYHRYFRGGDDRLDQPAAREALDKLGEFFDQYHLPFWGQILDSRQVRLFNREAIPQSEAGQAGRGPGDRRRVDLTRLHNLLWPDRGIYQDLDGIDELFQDMIRAGRPTGARGAAAYLSLLASAAERFTGRQEGP